MVQSKHFVAFFLAAAAIANVAALPTPTTTSQEIKHPIEPVSAVTGTPPAPGPTPHGELQKNDDSVSDAKKQEDRQARTSEWVRDTGAVLDEEARLAKIARAKEFEKKSQASSNALIEFVRKAHAPGKR